MLRADDLVKDIIYIHTHKHTHTHTHKQTHTLTLALSLSLSFSLSLASQSIVPRPAEILRNMAEVRSSFASYAHLKNAPHEFGWHCLSRTFDAKEKK